MDDRVTDKHYYEPVNGHGLKHDPFNAIIAPRPIGWIASRNAKGDVNLAPYSFFNAFCYKPPLIGFSSVTWKHTVANIQETGEFVWNLATMDLAQADEYELGDGAGRHQRVRPRRPDPDAEPPACRCRGSARARWRSNAS